MKESAPQPPADTGSSMPRPAWRFSGRRGTPVHMREGTPSTLSPEIRQTVSQMVKERVAGEGAQKPGAGTSGTPRSGGLRMSRPAGATPPVAGAPIPVERRTRQVSPAAVATMPLEAVPAPAPAPAPPAIELPAWGDTTATTTPVAGAPAPGHEASTREARSKSPAVEVTITQHDAPDVPRTTEAKSPAEVSAPAARTAPAVSRVDAAERKRRAKARAKTHRKLAKVAADGVDGSPGERKRRLFARGRSVDPAVEPVAVDGLVASAAAHTTPEAATPTPSAAAIDVPELLEEAAPFAFPGEDPVPAGPRPLASTPTSTPTPDPARFSFDANDAFAEPASAAPGIDLPLTVATPDLIWEALGASTTDTSDEPGAPALPAPRPEAMPEPALMAAFEAPGPVDAALDAEVEVDVEVPRAKLEPEPESAPTATPESRLALEVATQAAWELGRLPILLDRPGADQDPPTAPVVEIAWSERGCELPAEPELVALECLEPIEPELDEPAAVAALPEPAEPRVVPEPVRSLPAAIARLDQALFVVVGPASHRPTSRARAYTREDAPASTSREPGESRRRVLERRAQLDQLLVSLADIAGRSAT